MDKPIVVNPAIDAQELLDRLWWRDAAHRVTLPVDPFEIAAKLGIHVTVTGLERRISGMLAKLPGENPQIYLNGIEDLNRRRFTCAHELGHYFSHIAAGEESWENIDYRGPLTSEGTDPAEIYANQFAANLLMPANEIRRLKRQYTYKSIDLAHEFGVSEEALRYRLSNLRLV